MRAPPQVLVIVLCLTPMLGCERQAASLAGEGGAMEEVPDREVTGVAFTISHDGRARMRVKAPYMAEYTRADSAYTLVSGEPGKPGRVQVEVFDAAGALSATIAADRLRFDGSGEMYDVSGGVVVVTPEGRRLEGEHLAWYEKESKVRTPEFVRITSPSQNVQGYGLEAEEDLSSYTLDRVSGEVVVGQ